MSAYRVLSIRVSRKRRLTAMGEMFRALCELQNLRPPLGRVQAIFIRPGMGEMGRWRQAIEALQPHHHLLVAGAWERRAETWRPTPEILREFDIDPDDDRVHFQPTAFNTKDQSAWVVETIRVLKIRSVAQSVSPYHLVRGYMTDLATLRDKSLDSTVAMFPFPSNDSPLTVIPQTGLTMGASYQGEYERIVKYMKKGHVATWSQLYDYLVNTVWPTFQSFR